MASFEDTIKANIEDDSIIVGSYSDSNYTTIDDEPIVTDESDYYAETYSKSTNTSRLYCNGSLEKEIIWYDIVGDIRSDHDSVPRKFYQEWNGDKAHGLSRRYFDNGIIWEGYYVDGRKHGRWEYFGNDRTKTRITYANGVKDGVYYETDNQYVIVEGQYRNDMKYGKWTYYSNGLYGKQGIWETGNYYHDEKHGEWCVFKSDKVQKKTMYDHGTIVQEVDLDE